MLANLVFNNELNGIELYFGSKPEQKIIDDLKNNNFRWSNFKKCWYAKQKAETIDIANKYTKNNITNEINNQDITTAKINTKQKKDKNNLLPLWDRCQFQKGINNKEQHQYKFVGSNYNSKLTNKEIAVIFRQHLKSQFPEVKFSVRCEGYNSINIYIKESPYIYSKLEYKNNIEPREYRDFEKEHNKELNAILEYCNRLHKSYNFDDSDSMSDYFHVNYYGSASIDYKYKQTEKTEEQKNIMKEFRVKLEEVAKQEEQEKEKQYQEYLKQREIDKIKTEKEREESARQIEIINNNVTVKGLNEAEQYMIIGSEFAKSNKNSTLKQYKKEVYTEKDFYLQNVKITRELHFNTLEALQYFENHLLTDFDFLEGTGGSYTDDQRFTSMFDYQKMSEEERKTVTFNLLGIAVYFNDKLQFVIDTQGYSYSKYIGLTDNIRIEKTITADETISKEELTTLKEQVETLLDFSTETIAENNILHTWNTEHWKNYKEKLKERFIKNNFKLTIEIIRQIPEEQEILKIAMYKLVSETDSMQEQFKNIDLQQGQKITIFKINDFGMMSERQITVDSWECSTYAQYKDVIKLTFKPKDKRKLYYNYFYGNILVFNGWVSLPKTVLNDIEQSNGFIITKSKYLNCDKKQYDEILRYFDRQGIKPMVNTYKPQF
jgi:hypothetical protein